MRYRPLPMGEAAGPGWRREVRAQFRLALPVVVIQLGLVAMGAVDGAFLGRVDAVQYAAAAIGHSYTFLFFAFGMGFLTVLDPVVSQAWGARDLEGVARGLQRGLLLAFLVSIPIALVLLPAESNLRLARQKEEVIAVAAPYARVLILSTLPFLLFVAVRQAMQAVHLLRPLVLTILAVNVLNAFLDWVLIHGNLGAPAMGAMGSAWATVVARWVMVLLLLWLAGPDLWRFLERPASRLLHLAPLGRMTRLGIPVGIQWFVEVGAFAGLTAMMGSLGKDELAGNQVAMHLASASFMVPLGISMAASVRVGNEIGRGSTEGARRAARVAIATGFVLMLLFGTVFLAFPRPLSSVFTNIGEVLAVSVVLVPLAGLFQVFDGTQAVAVGVLRGMADTRVPMVNHILGFWGVAIPLAWFFGFARGHGAVGLWWGLLVGLALVALLQFLRLRVLLGRELSRVVIDHPEAGA